MEPIVWLVVGLIAGWLAGLVMKGSGYGLVGAGFVGTIVVALIGAVVFVGAARLLTRRAVRA